MPNARLAGKVALISGTGSGIGRAAALLFAREGATVVGADVHADANAETVDLLRREGLDLVSVAPIDLSTPDGAREWVNQSVRVCGGIDILYNNAGSTRMGSFPEVTPDDYDYTIRNELGITWHCSQAAWPHLIARGGGAIVMCGSIAGLTGTRDLLQAAHVAAKGAVMALTRQLAAEGAAHGIRVNSVSPGVTTSSPGVRRLLATTPQVLMPMVSRSYLGRAAEATEIASAALFLASDEARYISGANVVVDGGTSVLI